MWIIKKTDSFDYWLNKEGIDGDLENRFKKTLFEFGRNPTKRSKPLFQKGFYEVWEMHLPDKENNKGKSSGFRTMIRLNINTREIHLDVIIRRRNLNYKENSGKYQSNWDSYLKDFKKNKNYI